jgi:hypothetical protein
MKAAKDPKLEVNTHEKAVNLAAVPNVQEQRNRTVNTNTSGSVNRKTNFKNGYG